MASSSSSIPQWRYHVFLSFRGEDTRYNFVGHLYKELNLKGIYTFKDDLTLGRGKSIEPVILEAIRESRFAIVVLSQDYASSSWCLDELVEIMDCRNKNEQIVVPVFYNIDPSLVPDLGGSFEKAMGKPVGCFTEEEMEKVQRWREALTQVASVSGWDSRSRDESTLIEDIVRDVSDKIICASSSDVDDLVGMGLHITKIDALLDLRKNVVLMVGIWGIGGVGKTTMAKVAYDRHCRKFEACCFLANVRDKFRVRGPAALQEELLCRTLLETNVSRWPLGAHSAVIKERLSHKKALIVLDDVDNREQLEVLVRKQDWFGPGSRIIITTRNRHLLDSHGVNAIYEAQGLENEHALHLFSRHAFKQNRPKMGFLELTTEFVYYSRGLPLALKVLGSSLYKRSLIEWQSELEKLRKLPNPDIQNVLRISYEGLEDVEKNTFLDIACFFSGENKDLVRNILDGCGFFPDRSFGVLVDKALISISENKVHMPELLQRMGREIVRQESKELGRRSRMWDAEDISHVLTRNMGTAEVEGIFLDVSKADEMELNSGAFAGMCSLRLLKFYTLQSSGNNTQNVQLPEGLKSISDALRYLHWPLYPSTSLPLKFCPKYLVELNLPHSSIQKLWDGKQPLANLKSMDLSFSKLTRMPDLSEAHNLERLNLQFCTNLDDISSIRYLTKLEYLNLKGCKNIRSLPSITALECLKILNLTDCSNLEELSQLPRNMKYLHLAGTAIKELPQSVGFLSGLVKLDLRNCTRLKNLPSNTCKLKSLQTLNIARCSNLLKVLSQSKKGEAPSSNGNCSDYKPHESLHSISSNGMEIANEEKDEETEMGVNEAVPMELGEEEQSSWDSDSDLEESSSKEIVFAGPERRKARDLINSNGFKCHSPLELKENGKRLKLVSTDATSNFKVPVGQVLTSFVTSSESLFGSSQASKIVNGDVSCCGVVRKSKAKYGLELSSTNLYAQRVGYNGAIHFSYALFNDNSLGEQPDSSFDDISPKMTAEFEAYSPNAHKIIPSKAPKVIFQDNSGGDALRIGNGFSEKVSGGKSKRKDLIDEAPCWPVCSHKRMKVVGYGRRKAISPSKRALAISKRSAREKAVFLNKFRKSKGKASGMVHEQVKVSKVSNVVKNGQCLKAYSSEDDLQRSYTNKSDEQNEKVEASKEVFHFNEVRHQDEPKPKVHADKDTSRTALQGTPSPLSNQKSCPTIKETQSPTDGPSLSCSSISTAKSPHWIFTKVESVLGPIGITLRTNSAKTQLMELLAMGLPDLVRTKRLKEAAETIKTLEQGSSFLSKELISCLPFLKKLEEWGKNFQESEDHVVEAKRALALREELEGRLRKAYNENYQIKHEADAVEIENEKTQDSLVNVRRQIEDAKKKLEELQDQEKSLSDKAELHQENLVKLFKKQEELAQTTQQLFFEYQSHNEDTIRSRLTVEENRLVEIEEAYKNLQASLPSFC